MKEVQATCLTSKVIAIKEQVLISRAVRLRVKALRLREDTKREGRLSQQEREKNKGLFSAGIGVFADFRQVVVPRTTEPEKRTHSLPVLLHARVGVSREVGRT